MENPYSPPSPLEDPVLDGPLCKDFMGGVEDLQDISQSIDEEALSSLDVPEYQSSGMCSSSESSTVLGKKQTITRKTFTFINASI